ncbi:hypothetical protein HW555_012112 [Spodoptera exigua]|uniref:MADF domain-containing protein n=1 Tax=Spodoptera exigua TaxID=7107 RepID=A0A835L111_SPOEX|nr:hypothetical protein HW555_012112 [Spodoptera exigua]
MPAAHHEPWRSTRNGHSQCTAEACRHKWKTVRDSYIKHRKLLKRKTGKKPIEYIWASHLSFLEKHQVNRRSFYQQINDRNSYSPQPATLKSSKPQEKPQKPLREELSSIMATPPPLVPLSSKDENPFKFQAVKEVRTSIDTKTQRLSEMDATDLLFLSYSSTFKTLSGRQQALMKIQLAKLFANAELENLDNAEHSRDVSERNCSPVIVKTECYSDREENGQSGTSSYEDDDDNSDDKPLKRIRRGSST